MEAAHGGHLEVTRLLLDRSAGPHQARTDDGRAARMDATSHCHSEVAQLLQLFDADPSVQDDGGGTGAICTADAIYAAAWAFPLNGSFGLGL